MTVSKSVRSAHNRSKPEKFHSILRTALTCQIMDRQGHDYSSTSAMAYAQQQRQAANMPQQQQQPFGFHPQHQQYGSPLQSPPFLNAHPSLQQFPYRHPMQQHSQLPPHPHLLHLQQQSSAFPPHMPPPLVHSPFVSTYDSAPPPPPAAAPADPELQKRIDKLVEYIAKNGPEFEAMIREKQQDDPGYSFLFGGEGHNYYQYKLWISTSPPGTHFPPFPSSSIPMMHHPPNALINASPLGTSQLAAGGAAAGASASMLGGPQVHQPPFGSFYEQQLHQHPQPFLGHGRPEYDQTSKSFKGLSGPLPSDVAAELSGVLNNLSGTKDSIKGAKVWFMQRSPFAPALSEALRERVFSVDDSERQLHIIFLANDILFDSLQRRVNPHELDNEALAFKPVLGAMLARIYHNPHNREENQLRLQKILQFWASKEVYDQDTIYALESEMIGGGSSSAFTGTPKDLSAAAKDSASVLPPQPSNQNVPHWQHERQSTLSGLPEQERPDQAVSFSGMPPQQFLPSTVPSAAFTGSVPIMPASIPPVNPAPHVLAASTPPSEKLPPYPLFPPGLIPGMVKKMQIGSGVPYSPLSPLDIPTVIPPSSISPTETLERVSKFFKEIGEVNPSEGPMRSDLRDDGADDEYEREPPLRKGGACIPPPPNLQVDPETGTYADGSVVEGKGASGRLGLGATANPNEASQYDDVYTSYRKQRSTNYHSSMSARAAIR